MKKFSIEIFESENLKKLNKPIREFSVLKVKKPLLGVVEDKIPLRTCVGNRRFGNSQTIKNLKLNPWFVTGFTGGEGSFSIIVAKSGTFKVQWQARLFFQISLHVKDIILLEQIKKYFGVGEIYPKTSDSIIYTVKSIKDLTVIVNHFEKYPLITQKWANYEIWRQAFVLIKNKEHLTLDGLNKIVALKDAMNRGLSKELRTTFPAIVPIKNL